MRCTTFSNLVWKICNLSPIKTWSINNWTIIKRWMATFFHTVTGIHRAAHSEITGMIKSFEYLITFKSIRHHQTYPPYFLFYFIFSFILTSCLFFSFSFLHLPFISLFSFLPPLLIYLSLLSIIISSPNHLLFRPSLTLFSLSIPVSFLLIFSFFSLHHLLFLFPSWIHDSATVLPKKIYKKKNL